MSLKKYIEKRNFFRKWTNKPLLKLPLNQEEINDLADAMDNDMSPENLCCDGEISRTEAGRKANMLCKAFAELKQHAKKQGLSITVETYEIS